MKLLPWATVLVLQYFISSGFCGDAPIVELVNGKVKGEEKESRDDKDFYAYRGIPYARPPVGHLRFEAPQKADNWTGVWDGEEYGKKCIQWSTYEKEVDGDENCLFINVFTPKIGDGISKRLLPVLVYIHGGEFMTGTSEIHRAHYFMDNDVVVVTFNYRLGAFGFLSTDDSVANGNMGLKDQVLALKWVQENIRKFGGDLGKVTIFGQGSGAVSVHLLMLSPMAKGLFKKAISQSGNALQYTAIQTRPLQAAQRLARKLDCDEVLNKRENATGDVTMGQILGNSTLLVECLKSVKAKKIAEVHQEAFGTFRDPLSLFIPTVEKPLKFFNDTSETPFLTEHPFTVMLMGRQASVPWILGFNAQEGLKTTGVILNDKTLVSYQEDNWDDISSQLLSYPRSRTDLTKRIKRFYLSGKDYEFAGDNSTSNSRSIGNNTPQPSPPLPHLPPQPPQQPSANIHSPHFQIYPHLPKNSVALPPTVPLSHIITTTTTPVPTTTTSRYDVYKDEEQRTINFEEQFKSFTNMFTDRYFIWPMFEAIRLQQEATPTGSRIYAYENLYEGQNTLLDVYTGKSKEPAPAMKKVKNWFKTNILGRKVQAPKHLGVCFGDELPLLFKYPDLKIKENTKDYPASKELVKLWVQFATDETQMTYNNRTWTPVVSSESAGTPYNLMRFHNVPELSGMKPMSEALKSRLNFWTVLEHLASFNQ